MAVPNLPHESSPLGTDSPATWKCARSARRAPSISNSKDHVDGGGPLGLRFRSGHQADRFALLFVMKGHRPSAPRAGAIHAQHPRGRARLHGCYTHTWSTADSLRGTGPAAEFEADTVSVKKAVRKARARTSTYPDVGSIARISRAMKILALDQLPLKMTALPPCFPVREAGSMAATTRGMIRQHQFDKVEMVQVALRIASYQVLTKWSAMRKRFCNCLGCHNR